VLPDDAGVRWVDPSAKVCVVERTVPPGRVGEPLSALEASGVLRVVLVRRLGMGIVATPDLLLQEGDVVYLAAGHDQLDHVDDVLHATQLGAHAHSPAKGSH
jgi:trk system potassium uptake protein